MCPFLCVSCVFSGCMIKDEGASKDGKHFIFGIYSALAAISMTASCSDEARGRGPNSSALIRLSSENQAEAQTWIALLERAKIFKQQQVSGPAPAPVPADRDACTDALGSHSLSGSSSSSSRKFADVTKSSPTTRVKTLFTASKSIHTVCRLSPLAVGN